MKVTGTPNKKIDDSIKIASPKKKPRKSKKQYASV